MIPLGYPKWLLVCYYFTKYRDEEIFEYLNDMVRGSCSGITGKNTQCSVAIIYSQSVKTTCRGGLRGIDEKKIKGKKGLWRLIRLGISLHEFQVR